MNAPLQHLELIEPAGTASAALPVVQPVTPAVLLERALASGADMAMLERLYALQQRYREDEARNAYNAAFTAFKAEAVTIIKNRGVTDGPLKGKRYAELFAVVNAVTPALSKHGLSASWKLTKDDKDWIEVTCTLKHTLGHSESVSMGGPPDAGGAKNAIQARASTVSYLERYTLKAITGLSEQEDDNDGRGGASGASEGADDALIDAGRAASMDGMAALTHWWSTLDAKARGRLSKEFGAMRKAAALADQGGQP